MDDGLTTLSLFWKPIELTQPSEDEVHEHKREEKMSKKQVEKQDGDDDTRQGVRGHNFPTTAVGCGR